MIRRSMVLAMVALLGVTVLLAGGFGTAPADANQPPLADAGLDQEVTQGTTVYLDATGSVDPDGTIDAYRWVIERPDGTLAAPASATDALTTFVPQQAGQYEVTVDVTDDSGATSNDTLYVDVTAAAGPSVSISGPTTVNTTMSQTYEATASAGDKELQALTWSVNGTRIGETNIGGEDATDSVSLSLNDSISNVVTVVVADAGGLTDDDSLSTDAGTATASSGGAGPATTTGGGGGSTGGTDGSTIDILEDTIRLNRHSSSYPDKMFATDGYYNYLQDKYGTGNGAFEIPKDSDDAELLMGQTEYDSMDWQEEENVYGVAKSEVDSDEVVSEASAQARTDENTYNVDGTAVDISDSIGDDSGGNDGSTNLDNTRAGMGNAVDSGMGSSPLVPGENTADSSDSSSSFETTLRAILDSNSDATPGGNIDFLP